MNDKTLNNNNGLLEQSECLSLVINATGVGIWDWQVQTGKLTFNHRWAEIIGYTIDELQPIEFSTWAKNIHPEDLKKAQILIDKHFSGESEGYEIEARMKHKLGHYVWILATGKLIERADDGTPLRMIGTHQDISARKKSEESLIVTSQLLNESQNIAHLGGWELDLKTGQLFWTDETYRIHDTSPDEFNPSVDAGVDYFLPESKAIIVKAIDDAITNGTGYDLELETYTTKGRKIDVRTTCTVTQENGVSVRLMGIFQDITDQKNSQRKLEKSNAALEKANSALQLSAHYDALTGLPNRNLLADRMQQAVIKTMRTKKSIAIAFIDLDGFKNINDQYGHSFGDELLKRVSQQLQGVLREGDTLSRSGGDEFVALIEDFSTPPESYPVISRMLKSISTPLEVNDKLLNISASIGITFYPSDNSDPDQLIRHADQAMYIAKQKGKNCSHTFDIAENVAVTHRHLELHNIAQALKNSEFVLYYQPKVDLRSDNVIGFEALIRWDHPEKGILAPFTFLPAIEYDLLAIEIGKWVINTALQQLQAWQALGIDIPISVNISPLHLQHPSFVTDIQQMLAQYDTFKPRSIEFEIVESSALKDIKLVSNVIKECNQLGVVFSIDDFGTGYSSLTYLKRLPAEHLKIDQSFVRDMLSDADDKAIIQGTIELAKVFNLKVIAEGVETAEHGALLLSMGCFIVQGYGIARPMPAKHVPSWVSKWIQSPSFS